MQVRAGAASQPLRINTESVLFVLGPQMANGESLASGSGKGSSELGTGWALGVEEALQAEKSQTKRQGGGVDHGL